MPQMDSFRERLYSERISEITLTSRTSKICFLGTECLNKHSSRYTFHFSFQKVLRHLEKLDQIKLDQINFFSFRTRLHILILLKRI